MAPHRSTICAYKQLTIIIQKKIKKHNILALFTNMHSVRGAKAQESYFNDPGTLRAILAFLLGVDTCLVSESESFITWN